MTISSGNIGQWFLGNVLGLVLGMALNLYRRHRRDCTAAHAEDSRSGELEERSKKWKRCQCPVFAAGTLQGRFCRRATGKWIWEEAKAVAAAWESAGSWHGAPEPLPLPCPVEKTEGVTIASAAAAYIAVREGSRIRPSTMRKYRTFCGQLKKYAESKGYVMLQQFTSADIDIFYSGWKLGPRAKGKALGTLRSFFRFCVNREWIPKTPVSTDLKPPLGANRVANKIPFTDEELQRIIDVCDTLGTVEWKNDRASGAWSGEDTKDFIWLLTYTGLRISDAALFRMDRLRGNEVFLRAKKNGGDVFTWLPDWLVERLKQRSAQHGSRPFMCGDSEKIETVTDLWRRRINKVFALAGRFEERPTPHRFRHTFARILLERGVPVADVADLMADDEDTVREHYARWVPERQARLTNILQEAFAEKPKPKNVVEMPKTGTK